MAGELLPISLGNDIAGELEQRAFKQSLLDEDKRSTFLLRFQENFTIDEIGAMLGCPSGTVKSRPFYTCRLLADRLRVHDPTRKPEP